jgi:hypothetical protein
MTATTIIKTLSEEEKAAYSKDYDDAMNRPQSHFCFCNLLLLLMISASES